MSNTNDHGESKHPYGTDFHSGPSRVDPSRPTESREGPGTAGPDDELRRLRGVNAALLAALKNVEAIMSIVRPRSDTAEYLGGLAQARAAIALAEGR